MSLDLTYDPRAAGEVLRYHTWSVNHKQSVGEHTWQILRILLTVWPGAPRRVMIHTVVHDMGEMAGDPPYPFKQMFKELKQGTLAAENYVVTEMRRGLGVPQHGALSLYERAVFKLCEYVEMWEYGLHEVNMGNSYGARIAERMMREIGSALHNLEHDLGHTQDAQQHPGIPAAIHKYIIERMKMENTNG
jgi:hypothetical protein